MSNWSEYYNSRVGDSYPIYCEVRYKEFLQQLFVDKELSIREEGCGIGTISKILSQNGFNNLSAFDNDDDQLKLANINTTNVTLFKADIVNAQLNKVDMIHSHGVLEHFKDVDIQKIINRQRKDAKKVVHYVPTNGYSIPSFGDERLLSIPYWVDNFKPTSIIPFNNNKDLVLIWNQ